LNTAPAPTPPDPLREAFARDVHAGLGRQPRELPSKYFYDATGNRLFQRIMHMPEYYLTDCEYNVFQTHRQDMLSHFAEGVDRFRLIEFGAGDGLKTRVLLNHFLQQGARFTYTPIDISAHILKQLRDTLQRELPVLDIRPMAREYFQALAQLPRAPGIRNIVLFLGSNIGNFTNATAREFLTTLWQNLSPGDLLLIGMDLKKHPDVILKAYDDDAGITRDFNLNLLHRINRELGGNFDPGGFTHWPVYDPLTGVARSYLVSLARQQVHIDATASSYDFAPWESIPTENSQKYDLDTVESMCDATGFEVQRHFLDEREWFVDSLWRRRAAP